MGKSTPRPPPAPDPVVTIAAQQAANSASAQEQQRLNMVGTNGPTGTVSWGADPNQPGGYTQTTTLSPEQQQLYNSSTAAQNAALNLANTQIGRVGDALGQQFTYDNLPGLVGQVQGQSAYYSPIQAGQIYSPYGQQQTQQPTGSGAPPGVQTAPGGVGGGWQTQTAGTVPTPMQAQQPVGMAGGPTMPAGGFFQSGGGGQIGVGGGGINIPGAAGTVSNVGPFGPIQQSVETGDALRSGFAPGQAVQGQVASGGQIQQGVGPAPGLQTQLGPQGQIQGEVGPTDFTADRNAVTDAVFQQMMRRLNPEWDAREASMRARLAAQGFSSANSAGYQNSYDTYSRGRNDAEAAAMLNAIQQGAAEQNQLFGQSLAQGQFANIAQNQGYQQALGAAEFGNEAQASQYGMQLAGGQFANTAQQQQFGQNLAQGQFANQAGAQQFGQNQAQAEFYNQAQLAEFQRQLAAGQFANQAQGQGATQQLAQGELANQAASIQNQYGLGVGGLQVQSQGQQLQAQIAQAQLAAQQGSQQAQFFLDSIALANQSQSQAFSQNLAQQQLYNSTVAQNYGQQMGSAQFQNQARTQGAQEQAYAQNLPLQQFSALLGSGQVAMPQGISYSPTSVASTDVLGAYSLQQQAQQAAYQAQQRSSSGMMGGLFQLGAAALAAPMTGGGSVAGMLFGSERSTKTDIAHVGDWRGLPVYTFRYRGDPTPRIGVMADEAAARYPATVRRVGGMLAVDYGALAKAA